MKFFILNSSFFIFLNLFSLEALAIFISQESCGTVNLKSHFGKVRNQNGSGGICYAMTTADLIGEALGTDSPVSALHLLKADMLSPNWRDIPLVSRLGGQVASSTESYREKGRLCFETEMPSEPTEHDPVKRSLWFAKQLAKYYGKEVPEDANPSIFLQELEQFPEDKQTAALDSLGEEYEKTCHEEPQLSSLKITKVEIPEEEGETASENTQKLYLELIQSFLNRDRSLGIDWAHCNWIETSKPCGRDSFHVSSIIGRSWQNNSCHFLIRNSFGISFPCKSGAICADGYLWIDGSELLKKVFGVTGILKE